MKKQGKQRFRQVLIGIFLVFFAAAAVFGVFQVGMVALHRNQASASANEISIPEMDAGESGLVSFGPQDDSVQEQEDQNDTPNLIAAAKSVAEETEEQAVSKSDHGIFKNYWQAAQIKLQGMTLEQKIGQMFLFRCPQEGASETIESCYPGGFVLFGADFTGKTSEEVKQTIQSYQEKSLIPMAIAVDEEGGTVVRVSSNSQLSSHRFVSPQQVYASGGMNGVYNDAVEKSKLLLSLGINLNFAPVADVSMNPSSYMYDRTFGKDAQQTANYVRIVVDAMKSQRLSCTLKHFPGYGDNGDTHTGIVYDERSLQSFQENDFLPFQSGIDEGAECVLVSHNIVECMDAENPASLSPEVHRILREELGFTGVIVTDDLVMDAIREFTGGENPCVAAFEAGNDMLISSNIQEDYQALLKAAQDGTIAVEQIDERVTRILAWKYYSGIIA